MSEARRRQADEAFDLYDFGDMQVERIGAWQQHGNSWRQRVQARATAHGLSTARELVFVVRFVADSSEVEEAYFLDS